MISLECKCNIVQKETYFLSHEFWATFWIILVSLWGGFVSYFTQPRKFTFLSFIIHSISASFAGYLAASLCAYAGLTGDIVGVIGGMAGYMGTPAIVKVLMKAPVVKSILGEENK
jgi:CHASE2 domain-containing sensor protein